MNDSEKRALSKYRTDLVENLKPIQTITTVLEDIQSIAGEGMKPILDADTVHLITGNGTKTGTSQTLQLLDVIPTKDDGFDYLIYSLHDCRGLKTLADKLCSAAIPGDTGKFRMKRWSRHPKAAMSEAERGEEQSSTRATNPPTGAAQVNQMAELASIDETDTVDLR